MTGARAEWAAIGVVVTLAVTQPQHLAVARRAVELELAAFDAACSRFSEDSELSRAQRRKGAWVPVGPVLFDAVHAALWAAEATGGAVDPTVGRSLRVLGYDRDFSTLPSDGPLEVRVAQVPGWRVVELDRAGHRLRIPEGVELDLGATAKGLAADRAGAAALRAAGGGGVLVSLGGDIAVAGDAPRSGWPVQVSERADRPLGGDDQVLLMRTGGMATSTTTVRRWRRSGVDLHHIIDPRTGLPVDGLWRTATVAAASCLHANVASTAAIVLSAAAIDWLESHHLPGRLVDQMGRVERIAGWPN